MLQTAPPARVAASLARWNADDLLFGGADVGGAALGDAWLWDGAAWVPAPPAGGAPPARLFAAMVEP
jgi:hypothetical protein